MALGGRFLLGWDDDFHIESTRTLSLAERRLPDCPSLFDLGGTPRDSIRGARPPYRVGRQVEVERESEPGKARLYYLRERTGKAAMAVKEKRLEEAAAKA